MAEYRDSNAVSFPLPLLILLNEFSFQTDEIDFDLLEHCGGDQPTLIVTDEPTPPASHDVSQAVSSDFAFKVPPLPPPVPPTLPPQYEPQRSSLDTHVKRLKYLQTFEMELGALRNTEWHASRQIYYMDASFNAACEKHVQMVHDHLKARRETLMIIQGLHEQRSKLYHFYKCFKN